MRAGRLRQVALAVPIAIALLLANASQALACGILVSRSGLIEADAFTAMIAHDGAREDVAVRITYGSANEDFGWLMPVPSVPTLAAADLSGFTAAARITTPPAPPRGGTGFGVGAGAPGSVEEVSRSVIGDLEFVVLRATGTGALSEWMATNGFAFHYGQAESIGRYLDRGWLVIAARLVQQVATARMQASVRISFASSTLVYPLAAASATHRGSLRTTFFTITPWRPSSDALPEAVVRPGADRSFRDPGARLELRYAKPLDARDASSLSRTVPASAGAWLTRYDSRWDLTTLDRDLTLVPAADRSVIDFAAIEAADREEAPWPIAIAAAAVIAVVGLLLWAAWRMRWPGRLATLALVLVGSCSLAAAPGAEGSGFGLITIGWAILTAALFVAWRGARGRVSRRTLRIVAILSALLPVIALVGTLAFIALRGGICLYGYYDPGQC